MQSLHLCAILNVNQLNFNKMRNLTRVLFLATISVLLLTSCKDDEEKTNNMISSELSIKDFDMWWGGDPKEINTGDKFATIFIGDLYTEPGIKITYFEMQNSETSPIITIGENTFNAYSAYSKDGKVIFEDMKTKKVILKFEQINISTEAKTAVIEFKYNNEIIKMNHINFKTIDI